MNAANKLVLSLDGASEDLKEYLAGKSPGDECEFEVVATIDEQTSNQAVLSVKSADAMTEESEPEMEEMPSMEGGEGESMGKPKIESIIGVMKSKK
jgi:hypothetical protein